jgi:hypothetical protein
LSVGGRCIEIVHTGYEIGMRAASPFSRMRVPSFRTREAFEWL